MRLAGFVFILSWIAAGQGARPSFEVATIKLSPPDHVGVQIFTPSPDRFTAMTATLKDLLAFAYNVRKFQISGGPVWLDSSEYDISAKSEGAATTEQTRLMLQSLLAERFKVAQHHETKELTAYSLVVGKKGAQLKEVASEGLGIGLRKSQLNGRGATIATLARVLSDRLGRPVSDQTGLKGFYDFTLTWAAEDSPDASGPSIFTAMQEQLGLKLDLSKAPVDLLVIDRAEKPSEN